MTVTEKTLPLSDVLTDIFPPCRSTIFLTIARANLFGCERLFTAFGRTYYFWIMFGVNIRKANGFEDKYLNKP